jgi:hypothetical protein
VFRVGPSIVSAAIKRGIVDPSSHQRSPELAPALMSRYCSVLPSRTSSTSSDEQRFYITFAMCAERRSQRDASTHFSRGIEKSYPQADLRL